MKRGFILICLQTPNNLSKKCNELEATNFNRKKKSIHNIEIGKEK